MTLLGTNRASDPAPPAAREDSNGSELDRVLVLRVRGLYNEVRTHLALGEDAPLGRAVQRTGVVVAIPILSRLHHHYVRI